MDKNLEGFPFNNALVGFVMVRTILYVYVVNAAFFGSVSCHAETYTNNKEIKATPTIEEIIIRVHPVFDESNPKENNRLFRFVNRLHINTKKSVIMDDLTFKEGESLDGHLLDESERRLRSRRYFAAACVTEVNSDSAKLDSAKKVQVDVREVWTLVPKVTYSSTGGSTHYGYGLYDSNFLGLGKTIKIERSSTVERTSDTLVYKDSNFANQKQLSLAYSDNSDGVAREFHLSNPFRSIRTPWTVGIDMQDFSRDDTLFNAGEEAMRFGHDGKNYSVFYGQRLDTSNDDRTHRWLSGLDNISDTFYSVPDARIDDFISFPIDRDYTVTWLEYSYLHNRFFEVTNLQQINRTEDINLGSQWRIRLGAVTATNELLDNSVLVEIDYSKAYQLSPSQLLLSHLSSTGFYGDTQTSQSISRFNLSYHWMNFSRGQFFISANKALGRNLFMDTPLELGGDTGLRGYPARFMAGDRSRLLTIEQRYFGGTEWFSLFHLGAAVFYDQGKAWGNANIPQHYQGDVRDLGIGLRISGTRTGGRDEGVHNIAHIDLAYPLDGGAEIDKYQLSVQIKTSF
ncbi:hypothetical protein O59_003991 [Cellvibrio sp. BR]|uniref:hypothetical protein n=1 Tax=Cellvibrio sp. BR TaxID=1134474 RepID=UPI0002600AC9|nr:hypothetical protein [Cellvibrio sp. BR]EIK43198.1 hypothetical protein O59_003991 [Cellvibrio sp. BR]